MTVRELIKELSRFPESLDEQVLVSSPYHGSFPICSVSDDDTPILICFDLEPRN